MLGLFKVATISTSLQVISTVVLYNCFPIVGRRLFENMLTASTHKIQRFANVNVLLLLLLLILVNAGHVLFSHLMLCFQMIHQLIGTLEYAQAIQTDVLLVYFSHVFEEIPVLVVGSTRRTEEYLFFVLLFL